MTEAPEAMESEFDTVASWTVDAIESLGPDHAVPGACRGSGGPAALAWLADSLAVGQSDRVLDAGGGLGGPVAWLAERTGASVVVTEPMVQAAAGARRLFGLASVSAWAQRHPFPPATFDAAWSLGVLCTTDDHPAVLGELARLLRPGGRLGLLVYVAVAEPVPGAPEGNHFPIVESLRADVVGAGLTVTAEAAAADLPGPPEGWAERADRVEQLVADRHRSDPQWKEADDQERRLGQLLADGHVAGHLLLAAGADQS